jgi:hypothetical protein
MDEVKLLRLFINKLEEYLLGLNCRITSKAAVKKHRYIYHTMHVHILIERNN